MRNETPVGIKIPIKVQGIDSLSKDKRQDEAGHSQHDEAHYKWLEIYCDFVKCAQGVCEMPV